MTVDGVMLFRIRLVMPITRELPLQIRAIVGQSLFENGYGLG